MINVSTDHSPLRRHTKPIDSEWPHPSGGSLSPHRKSPFSRNGHTPQPEAFHLIEKVHSIGMAILPRRKPFTSSEKPIQPEWPHPPGGSLSPHRKSLFIRNGHIFTSSFIRHHDLSSIIASLSSIESKRLKRENVRRTCGDTLSSSSSL